MYLNNEMSSEIHDKNIEEDEPNEMIDGELINRQEDKQKYISFCNPIQKVFC